MKKIRIAQVKLHRAVVKPLALGIGEPRKMLSLRSLRDLSAFSEKIKHRVLKSSDSEWKKFSLEYLEEGGPLPKAIRREPWWFPTRWRFMCYLGSTGPRLG